MTSKSTDLALLSLSDYRDDHCISIYLPLNSAGEALAKNRLRLQEELLSLDQRLGALAVPEQRKKEILAPAWRLSEEDSFWQAGAAGLAMFLSHDRALSYWLQWVPPALTLIGRRFHLRPLLVRTPTDPVEEAALRSIVTRFNRLADTDHATDDLEEIVTAAKLGTIDTLVVAKGVPVWGRYDSDAEEIETRLPASEPKEDLVDLAVTEALRQGATVYGMNPDDLPFEGVAAAILRSGK